MDTILILYYLDLIWQHANITNINLNLHKLNTHYILLFASNKLSILYRTNDIEYLNSLKNHKFKVY